MRRPAVTLAAALGLSALAAPAGAQCVFQINQSTSDFTWTGTTSLGPLVGTPTNQFELQGTVSMEVAAAGNPASTGEFVGGDALVVPDISGEIPNVFPFLPPLATVDVTNLRFSVVSDVFLGAPAEPGTFVASSTLIALSGTANVVPLVGTPSNVDLSGAASDPVPVVGTLTQVGSNLDLLIPINVTVPIDDPTLGLTGSFTLTGVVDATADLNTGCATSFFTDVDTISLLAGGAQQMFLDADAPAGFQLYWILGSASGTSPGLPPLPLNFDGYFLFTLNSPNTLIASSLAFLDATGRAQTSLALPPGLDPGLAGVTLNHAFVAIDLGTFATLLVSNPKPLGLVP